MPGDSQSQYQHASSAAAIDAYLTSLVDQCKLSPHTVRNYSRDLAELFSLISALSKSSEESVNFTKLSHMHIRKFAAQLHSRGLNARSIARKLSAWRGFFNWLGEHTPLANNPVEGIKAPKRAKPLPKVLGQDDTIRLVTTSGNAVSQQSPTLTACNRAMFELLYSSGLRVSELAGLDLRYTAKTGYTSDGWIDTDAAEVNVTGKGDKKRTVPVGQPALQAIAEWLPLRNTLVKHDNIFALFLTERGSRMSPRVIQLRLKAHAQALNIPTAVHPHVLRHSFASHLLQGSGDLRAVQEMLGHTSITSTQVYTYLDFQRLAQVYDAAHPRAKKMSKK
ncbi:MAG: tyrosine recombinase XerC [Glaciimonas sp.]|nr:tyrosine recombinase XerC [Glaciimonas sp.]